MSASSHLRFAEHRARQTFARYAARLERELDAGTERRHLDPLVDLLERVLPECGPITLEVAGYRRTLAALKSRVEARRHLRRIK